MATYTTDERNMQHLVVWVDIEGHGQDVTGLCCSEEKVDVTSQPLLVIEHNPVFIGKFE